MSLEAIKSIGETEENARQALLYAQQRARNSIEEARISGNEAVSAAAARADSEVLQLRRDADANAAESAKALVSSTANRRASLRARAESRLDKAAELIVERIVNS